MSAQNHIIYSTHTLYLGNSPACGANKTIAKLAYNNILLDEIKRVNNRFFHKIINDKNILKLYFKYKWKIKTEITECNKL